MIPSRRLGKNSFIYTGTSILQRGTAFFLLPLYTRYLSPHDYGVLSVVIAINGFLVILFTMSLHGALTRYYFSYRDNPQQLREFWGSLLTFIFLISVTGGIVLLMFGAPLLKPFIGQVAFWPYVALGIAAMIFQPFFTIFLALLQTKEQAGRYAVYSLCQFFTNMFLTVGFVVFLGWGISGALIASLITAVGFFLTSLYSLRHEYKICLRTDYLKLGLSYSLPLVPHSLSAQISSVTDRMLLNSMLSTTAAGMYNVGFMFGSAMSFVTDSVNRAYVPINMSALQSRDETQLNQLSRIGLVFVVIYALLGTLISFFAAEITSLSTPTAYHESYIVIPYIAFTFVLQGLYYIFVNILFFVGRATKLIALGTAVGAVSNVVLNLLMIHPYGLKGAAIATLSAQFIATVFIAILGKAYELIRWEYTKFLAVVGLCLALSIAISGLPISMGAVVLKLCLFVGLYLTLNLWLWRDAFYLARCALQSLREFSVAT